MSKLPKLYRKNRPADRYKYVELQLLSDEYSSFGVDIRGGELTIWSLGTRAHNAPVSVKKIRKFAKALLKLADQVDPPAPKVKYFVRSFGLPFYFREVDGSPLDLWIEARKEWQPSWGYKTGSRLLEAEGSREITADELPAGAR
ncbi:hypothetical protein ACWEF6_01825 [Amycolatopsis sp. NPDC004772]